VTLEQIETNIRRRLPLRAIGQPVRGATLSETPEFQAE
jgi:hypothetical protein